MAGYQLADDGTLDWLNNSLKVIDLTSEIAVENSPYSNSIEGLYACDLKTNVLGQSVKIQKENSSAIFHLTLKNISSFKIISNRIEIRTADSVPFTLTFVDSEDCLIAANNLDLAINGKYISCNEQILNYTYNLENISYPALLFIDNNAISRVTSDSDLVNKVNSVMSPFYFISLVSGVITLSTYKKYLNNLPSKFSLQTNYFGGTFSGNNLQVKVDFEDKYNFWIYDGNNIYTNNFNFSETYPSSLSKEFELYYSDFFLRNLNITNSNLQTIFGTLPNQLQNITIDSLASIQFLNQVPQLKMLTLINSQITSLPSNLNGMLWITALDFENCKFTSFPTVDNLPNLLSVTIKNTPIQTLPSFDNSNKLKSLTFINCPLTTFNNISPSVISFTAKQLQINSFNFPNSVLLQQLDLSNGILSNIDLSLIMNPALESINLSSNNLDLSNNITFLTQLFNSGSMNGILDLSLNLFAGIRLTGTNTNIDSLTPDLTALGLTSSQYSDLVSAFKTAIDNLSIYKSWKVIF